MIERFAERARPDPDLAACGLATADRSSVVAGFHALGARAALVRRVLDVDSLRHRPSGQKKDSFVLGHADYHYAHEPILFGYVPGGGRRGRGGSGWYGDNAQSSVFEVPKPRSNEEHPTMIAARAMLTRRLDSAARSCPSPRE